MDSWVAATRNVFVSTLRAAGGSADGEVSSWLQSGSGSTNRTGRDGDAFWMERAFLEGVDISTGAAVAFRLLGTKGPAFTLRAGESVVLVATMESRFREEKYVEAALRHAAGLSPEAIERLRSEHESWWADHWAKSYVDIPDGTIEHEYYRSLYVLGSCSRDPAFPPPIFGTWTLSDHPGWNGEYHLNYGARA